MGTPTEISDSASSSTSLHPVRRYFRTLKALLTHPTAFFRSLKVPVHPAFPLIFALITHWIGSALEYLWTAGLLRTIQERSIFWQQSFRKFSDQIDSTDRVEAFKELQGHALHWLMGAGSVMIDPFKTLLKILFQTFFIWVAARLFVSGRGASDTEARLQYSTALALVCFSMAPAILSGIPFVGTFVAWTFTLALLMIGGRELFRTTPSRAMLIVFFPQILGLALILMLIAALGLAFMKLFWSMFSANA